MQKTPLWSKILIIGGLLLLAGLVFVLKGSPTSSVASSKPADLPEAQLERALADGKTYISFLPLYDM